MGDEDGNISQEEAQGSVNLAPFEMSIKWDLDQKEALSNGDKVKLIQRSLIRIPVSR